MPSPAGLFGTENLTCLKAHGYLEVRFGFGVVRKVMDILTEVVTCDGEPYLYVPMNLPGSQTYGPVYRVAVEVRKRRNFPEEGYTHPVHKPGFLILATLGALIFRIGFRGFCSIITKGP